MGGFDKLPRVDPGLPPVRSNSFDGIPGAHSSQPPVPCLWNGHLRLPPKVHEITWEGECVRSIISCQGLIWMSTAGSTQEAKANAPYVWSTMLYIITFIIRLTCLTVSTDVTGNTATNVITHKVLTRPSILTNSCDAVVNF